MEHTQLQLDDEGEISGIFAAFEDPFDAFMILLISVLCTVFLAYMDVGRARHSKVDPPRGPQGIKGWQKPEGPAKSITELKELERRNEELPLFSMEELGRQDGHQQTPWVCLKGVIYDVSTNEEKMYARTGGYNLFAGREASCSLATMTFDKIMSRDWRKCSKDELQILDDWIDYYKSKYTVVGYLKEEYESMKKDQ